MLTKYCSVNRYDVLSVSYYYGDSFDSQSIFDAYAYPVMDVARTLWLKGCKVGVICRGAQGGGAPLVNISAHFGGLSPTKILALAKLFIAYWPCFQSVMINCALLYDY